VLIVARKGLIVLRISLLLLDSMLLHTTLTVAYFAAADYLACMARGDVSNLDSVELLRV
jgi:hypothetical protein